MLLCLWKVHLTDVCETFSLFLIVTHFYIVLEIHHCLCSQQTYHQFYVVSLHLLQSFKRRYFYLKQQADTTYILEMHKDDKRLEAKGSIFLDSATNVSKVNLHIPLIPETLSVKTMPQRNCSVFFQTTKRGKFSFEIQMQDRSSYLLAAESEQDLEDWVKTLKKVIATNEVSNAMIDRLRDRGH